MINLIIISWLAILVYVSWRKLPWGIFLICLILPSYLIRTKIWFMPTTMLELSIYAVFLVWLLKYGFSRIYHGLTQKNHARFLMFYRTSYLIPIILLFIACIISVYISSDRQIALGVFKAWFIVPLILFFLILQLIKTKKQILMIIWSLLLSASVLSIYGIIEKIFGFGLPTSGRVNSVFIPANYLSLYIGPIICLAIGMLVLKYDKKIKTSCVSYLIPLLLLVICIIALFLTRSYGGWFGVGAGLGFIFFFLKFKRKWIYLILVGVIALTFIALDFQTPKFRCAVGLDESCGSFYSRIGIWKVSWQMIKEHPISGIGLAFEPVYRQYIKLSSFKLAPPLASQPHNLYLAFWAETGILGLIAFLWILVFFFKSLIFKKHPSFFTRSLSVGLSSAMVCVLVHGLVDVPYWKNDLSCLFWVIVGIGILISRLNKEESVLK